MIIRQITPQHQFVPPAGYILTGYVFRLQSSSTICEQASISLEVDGVDRDGNNTKSTAHTLVEAPKNIKSIDVEIKLDCPLRSVGNVANMAYKLEPVDSHEIENESIEYERISEAVIRME
ncbi:MAG: hypothetical protein WBQ16_14305 [Nitrososphaeraceae archaeon]